MATFKAGPAHPSRPPRPRSSLPGRQRRGRHPAAFLTLVRSPIRSFVPIFILGTHFCSLMVCNAPGERQRVREQRRRRGRPRPRLTRREGGREKEFQSQSPGTRIEPSRSHIVRIHQVGLNTRVQHMMGDEWFKFQNVRERLDYDTGWQFNWIF